MFPDFEGIFGKGAEVLRTMQGCLSLSHKRLQVSEPCLHTAIWEISPSRQITYPIRLTFQPHRPLDLKNYIFPIFYYVIFCTDFTCLCFVSVWNSYHIYIFSSSLTWVMCVSVAYLPAVTGRQNIILYRWLVQERHNSSALAMDLCLSCTNTFIYSPNSSDIHAL